MSSASNPPRMPADRSRLAFWGVLAVLIACSVIAATRPPTRAIPVLAHDVPAYRVIGPDDLTTVSVPAQSVGDGVLGWRDEAIGRYSVVDIPARTPIRSDQLARPPDSRLLANVVAVRVPAWRLAALSGPLRPGDLVSLGSSPPADSAEGAVTLSPVLVLDGGGAGPEPSAVFAIPAAEFARSAVALRDHAWVAARHVQ